MTPSRHTQKGWAILIPELVVLAVLLNLLGFSVGPRWTFQVLVAGLLAVVVLLFATLTVTVSEGWVEAIQADQPSGDCPA
jgi:hypothetical protein